MALYPGIRRHWDEGLEKLSRDLLDLAKSIRLGPQQDEILEIRWHGNDPVVDAIVETDQDAWLQGIADLLLDNVLRCVHGLEDYIVDRPERWERKGRCTKLLCRGMVDFAQTIKYDVYGGWFIFDGNIPWIPREKQIERLYECAVTAAAATKEIREVQRAIGVVSDMMALLKVESADKMKQRVKKGFTELSQVLDRNDDSSIL